MPARGALSRDRGWVASVSNSSGILQQTVCPRKLECMRHLLINRGTTTKALLFVRLAKMSRVFNSLVTEPAAIDSVHFFASNLGGGTAHAGASSARGGGKCFDLE